jgi:hypothetical protein
MKLSPIKQAIFCRSVNLWNNLADFYWFSSENDVKAA